MVMTPAYPVSAAAKPPRPRDRAARGRGVCEDPGHDLPTADVVVVSSGEASPSERRLVENEQILEALNRRIGERVEEIRSETDAPSSAPVRFFCECSDIACRGRIAIAPSRFTRIHRDPALFIVLPGHENSAIETVVDAWGDHAVVRKALIA